MEYKVGCGEGNQPTKGQNVFGEKGEMQYKYPASAEQALKTQDGSSQTNDAHNLQQPTATGKPNKSALWAVVW